MNGASRKTVNAARLLLAVAVLGLVSLGMWYVAASQVAVEPLASSISQLAPETMSLSAKIQPAPQIPPQESEGLRGVSPSRAAIETMLVDAATRHGVNPYLVMGLAWHESGWQPSVVSSAGAVGIMQVMPATAAAAGPALLHRQVDLYNPADNIDMGTAILRAELDRFDNDLVKALVAYYAGGAAVTSWNALTDDERRYVLSVYDDATLFARGMGPA